MTKMRFTFHEGPTGNRLPDSWYQDLHAAGIPFSCKITDAAPSIVAMQLAMVDSRHTVIYRRSVDAQDGSTPPSGNPDVPRYEATPQQAAAEHWAWHKAYLPPEVKAHRSAVWLETINEVDKNRAEWLAEFASHTAALMWADGYKWLAFGFSGGEPEPYHWHEPKMLDFLRLCAANPHRLGIALHEYSLSSNIWNGTAADGSHWLVGRFEHLHAVCDANGIARPRIDFTEWGWGRDTGTLPAQVQRMKDYADVWTLYAKSPNIKSAAGWCFNGGWKNIGNELVKDVGGLKKMTIEMDFEEGTEPPPVEPPAEGTTPQKIFQISQGWAFSVNEDAALQKKALADGFTPSGVEKWQEVDGGKYAMQPFYRIGKTNDKRSYYATVGDWGNVKWTDGSAAPEWTILDVPHLTQVGNTIKNECGAACVAMVARLAGKTPTVDEVATKYQNPPNSYMSFTQIDTALNGYGMDGTLEKPFYPRDAAWAIEDGEPAICLVHYGAMPQRFDSFTGAHFIVAYGTDGEGKILYRDPLQVNETPLLITFDALLSAMAQAVHDGNLAYQAMTCSVKAPPVEPPPTGKTYNTADFMIPDPRSWVVVDRGPAGGEDIWHLFTGGQMIRVKNRNQAEWYTADGLKRIRDTSPQDDPTYGPCLYLQHTNGQPGGQIAPAVCQVGVTYEYFSDVQFKAKSDCRNLTYRSGRGRSTFMLKEVRDNYTFANGQKVDRLFVTIQTGEIQLYAIKDGVKRGWCGGGAEQAGNVWTAIPSEFYLDRKIPQEVPPSYCS